MISATHYYDVYAVILQIPAWSFKYLCPVCGLCLEEEVNECLDSVCFLWQMGHMCRGNAVTNGETGDGKLDGQSLMHHPEFTIYGTSH